MMAADEPILTIGLPVFNGERYFEQAIAGLQAQKFTEFEVLIADNASTDRTSEIAQAVCASDPRFRYLRREENIGLVPNFNQTFTETRSKFFAWHASDDIAQPEFYGTCVQLLQDHPEAAAAFSAIDLIGSDGESLGAEPENIRSDHPNRAARFAELASFRHYCQFSFGVYRRSMMAQTRLMLPFWTCDRLFLAELALQGTLVRDPRQLFHIRQHTGRVTTKARASFYAAASSPQRGTTLRYSRELRRAIDHAHLEPAELGPVLAAYRAWQLRNTHRLARSAAGALVGTVGARLAGQRR